MTVDEIIKKAKELLTDKNIDAAKNFIEEHKDELGAHYEKLTALINHDADNVLDKVKGFFSKK